MAKTLLQDGIDQWFQHREAEGIAYNTVRTERTILRALLTSTGNIYVENITGRHIDTLMRKLGKTRGANTRRLDHGVLSKFFAWCADTGLSQRYHNPMKGHRRPRAVKVERRHVHVSKFPALLDATKNPRDRAFVALTLYLFLRQSETTALRVKDVDLQAGLISVWQPKTQQSDRMPISAELGRELRAWLTHYSQDAGPLRPDWYLVPAYTRSVYIGQNERVQQHLQPTKVFLHPERMVQNALVEIGFCEPTCTAKTRGLSPASGQKEGCHTLRRSGARALFDHLIATAGTYDGAGRTVQAMLHHQSFETTEHYLGINLDKARRDDLLQGKEMFPALTDSNVVQLVHGQAAESAANV